MITKDLHENWSMHIAGSKTQIPAVVPGSVYNDLLQNGLMEDPYWRDNEIDALQRMDDDYEYELVFDVSKDILSCEEILLHFDGLDTVADICLNHMFIASVKNMHRIWEYPVKQLLKEAGNELRIVFHSPTKYIKEAYEECELDGSSEAMTGFPHLRKAHYMFGWDWGPRLPDCGIWRAVRLIGIEAARINNVYITQNHNIDCVELNISVQVDVITKQKGIVCSDWEKGMNNLIYEVTIFSPEGEAVIFKDSPKKLVIDKPKLWWPNGYGAQPLYKVSVELIKNQKVIDSWNKSIGLRTVTMHVEKDDFGESFCHRINGVDIFAMGADYIPEDNILSRVNREKTFLLIKQCRAANFNVIRVWGGGYYPEDFFYEACDEMGILVWQDFMFACAVYELTEEFEKNITEEFIDNIKRIRHHASLALWCGNNEMEMFIKSGQWVKRESQRADYIKMYEYLLPKVLKQYDPNTFYWPSSPSSGGSFDEPNDENRGDAHYWDVWHGNVPFSEYRKFKFRYVSEFGFQSFPCLKTVKAFSEEKDWNIFSYVMEKHQRNSSANAKIINYLSQTYLYPSNFDMILYASQLLQGDAIRYGVEHFRRNRGRCMGTIYWQLNDCWPVASWSSVDYYGRWKALHYFAKRFFAPLMVSCEEEGILTQDTNVNAQSYDIKRSIRLCVCNETMQNQQVTVCWALRNNKADILKEASKTITVPALTSLWLQEQALPEAQLYTDYVSYDLYQDEERISGGTVLFSLPKHYNFLDPKLTYRREKDEIIVTADTYAKGVEIQSEAGELLLSDNYFDMNAGETRIKILKGDTGGIKLRSVYNIR